MGQRLFLTTENFWDCECEENYIHPKAEGMCEVCKYTANDSPNSRVNEVAIREFILCGGKTGGSVIDFGKCTVHYDKIMDKAETLRAVNALLEDN